MNSVNLAGQYGFGWANSLSDVLQVLVVPAFGIASVAVTIYFIVGATQFITSAGQKEKVAGARAMMTHAFIGLLLLVVAFILLEFVPEILGVNLKFFN